MKKAKFFKVTFGEEVHYCATISAVVDIIAEKGWPIKPYQIWKLSKEIGERHQIGEFELSVLPMLYHQNPNKGGYRAKKIDNENS